MSPSETALIRKILGRHGARPDLRLWRNATAQAYVGKVRGRSRDGKILHIWGGRTIQAGLCEGSSDLVGIKTEGDVGRFVALEVKTENVVLEDHQERFLGVVRDLGGIAGVVRSVEDVDDLLGEPPEG